MLSLSRLYQYDTIDRYVQRFPTKIGRDLRKPYARAAIERKSLLTFTNREQDGKRTRKGTSDKKAKTGTVCYCLVQ